MMIRTLTVALALVAFQDGREKYTNLGLDFEAAVPKGWLCPSTPTSTIVEFNEAEGVEDRGRSEIRVTVATADVPTPPDAMKENMRKSLNASFKDRKELWTADAPVGGLPACQIASQVKSADGQRDLILIRTVVSRSLIDKLYISGAFDAKIGDAAKQTMDAFLKSLKHLPRIVSAEDQKLIDRFQDRIRTLSDVAQRLAGDEWYALYVGPRKAGWYHIKSEGATIGSKPGISYTTTLRLTDKNKEVLMMSTEGRFTLDLSAQTETTTEELKDAEGKVKRSHKLAGKIEGAKATFDREIGTFKESKAATLQGTVLFTGCAELVRRALVPGRKDTYAARVLLVSEEAPRLERYEVGDIDRGQIGGTQADFQPLTVQRMAGAFQILFDPKGNVMQQAMQGGLFKMERCAEADATREP